MLDPRSYSPRRAQQLLFYLLTELRRARQDRSEMEGRWIRYEETYRAQPFDKQKTFPFLGASNLVIPVMATDVDTLYSRLMGLLFEQPGLWTVNARRPEMEEIAPRIEEFLTWAQENEIDMQLPVGDWLLDIMKLGTGVLKQRYQREQRKVFEWRELTQGVWQQDAVVLLTDAPAVNRVRLPNFWVPAGFKELSDMPWCGEDINLTVQQFMNRVQAGLYYPTADVNLWANNSAYYQQPVQRAFDVSSGYAASQRNQLRITEFWTDFDIDEDGYDEALVCTIHEDSESYIRIDKNPFFNQEKPYTVSRFMRDGNSFYGIGLGEMLDHFQEEITAMHNQRIDAGTISNSIMIATSKSNTDIADDEPFWPGKNWRVNNPQTDIREIQLGNPNTQNASINNEAASTEWAHRRDGVNDYVMGNATPDVGYGTAYTTQQMLLNATKRLGETVREVHRGLSETGTRVLELYQQFNQNGKEFFALGQQDGALVRMVLQFPLDLIRRGLKVSVRAIDAANSKDAQIRTNTVVLQQLMQFYQYYMQALSYMVNPQVPPPIQQAAAQMVDGASIMMRRLLTSYNVQDADRMIPDLGGANADYQRQLLGLQQALLTTPPGRTPPAFGGQPQIGGGAAPAGGMGGVPALPGGAQGAGYQQLTQGFGPANYVPSSGGAGYGGAYPGALRLPAFATSQTT